MSRGRITGAVLITLVVAMPAAAQQPGPATFRVLERGELVGSASADLTRERDGWRLRGTSDLPGLNLSVKQFDVSYDVDWRPRFMTLQMTSPDDDVIVHVAFGLIGGRTRTDIVKSGEALYGENRLSIDTIVLPDMVFSAYEALAARLASATPGATLRAFIVPRTEVSVRADEVSDAAVTIRTGTVGVRRWRVRLMRAEGPTAAELWIADGRLVRLHVPKDGLTAIREDVAQ